MRTYMIEGTAEYRTICDECAKTDATKFDPQTLVQGDELANQEKAACDVCGKTGAEESEEKM